MSPLTAARIAEFKKRALESLEGQHKAKKYDASAINEAHDTSGQPRCRVSRNPGIEPVHPSVFDYSTGGGCRIVKSSNVYS